MNGNAPTTRMATFVPRVAAASERAATNIARRVMAPLRAVGSRAVGFADRVLSSWLGAATSVGGGAGEVRRPNAPARSAEFVMPRPWYESDTPVVADALVRRQATSTQAQAAVERGAAIVRTQLDAPARADANQARPPSAGSPAHDAGRSEATDSSAPSATAPARDTTAAEALGLYAPAAAVTAPFVAVVRTPLERALAHASWVDEQLRRAVAPTAGAPQTATAGAGAASPRARETAGGAYVFVAGAEAPRPAAGRGAFTTASSPQPEAVSPTTSTATLVSSTASASERETLATAGVTARTTAPVAVAVERPTATATGVSPFALPELGLALALAKAPAFGGGDRIAAFVERLVGSQARRDVDALPVLVAAPSPVEAPSRAAERAPSGVLVRLPERAEPGDVASAPTGARAGEAARATGPGEVVPIEVVRELLRVEAPRFVPTEAPVLRPGAVAVRAEQFAAVVDARGASAWGEPLPVASRSAATGDTPGIEAMSVGARAPERPLVAPVSLALVGEGASRATSSSTRVPAAAEPAPAIVAAAETVGRAHGAAALAQFVEQLVGVRTLRASAPEPIEIRSLLAGPREWVGLEPAAGSASSPATAGLAFVAPRPAASSSRASTGDASPTTSYSPAAASRATSAFPTAGSTPTFATPRAAASRTPYASTGPLFERALVAPAFAGAEQARLRPGGVAVWAERVAGEVGVRAAGLSIDFVDPSRLPALTSGRASGDLSYLWPRERAPEAAHPSLSFEEWALVATFPSQSTAMQVAMAHQGAVPTARAGAPSARGLAPAPLVALGSDARPSSPDARPSAFGGDSGVGSAARASSWARRFDLPRDVVSAGFASETRRAAAGPGDRALLPGGRVPRGSFTWPKLADFTPQTKEFTPSRGVQQAEHVADAAPGSPLWSTMRPLVALSGGAGPAGGSGAARSGASDPTAIEREAMLGLARPILQLVQGGVTETSGDRVRFTDTPLVTGVAAPAGDATQKMIEAVRQPAATPTDDRISLADLTLISIASATQQVAASEAGSAPAAPAHVAEQAAGGAAGALAGKAGAKQSPASEIEMLARRVFDELRRRMEVERERSGDPWEC